MPPINRLRVGEILVYSDKFEKQPSQERIEGLPNYYAATYTAGTTTAKLVKGINPLQSVKQTEGRERMPAIIIVSSPRKAGSEDTPWENYLDVDNGYARYFGDNYKPDQDPDDANGNYRLIEQFKMHKSENRDERIKASPIVIFERTAVGRLLFQGIGIITSMERVMQRVPGATTAFANYAFELTVLSLAETGDTLDWNWISKRRNPSASDQEAFELAPESWKTWVNKGNGTLTSIRRSVAKTSVVAKEEQLPDPTSIEYKDLVQIYDFYTDNNNKHGFEYLAYKVAERLFQVNGRGYTHGWITKASGDGGADFVGRLDVGDGFSKLRIVVLGQAKCEKIATPTGGNHIARLVSRLRRGWVGVYVTTSFFSDPVQQEVIEDRCPIMMVNGKRVAQETRKMARESGLELLDYLKIVDGEYREKSSGADVLRLDPEQVLFNA
jgi:hypothetical protein